MPRLVVMSAYALLMAHGDTTLLRERTDPDGDGSWADGSWATDAPAGTPADVEPGTAAPSGLVASLKSFAGAHDGATAVIEYVGRRGARIVLVGADGEWEDQLAPGTDVARQACATAGVPVENSWERELVAQMRPTRDLWRSMGRRTLTR